MTHAKNQTTTADTSGESLGDRLARHRAKEAKRAAALARMTPAERLIEQLARCWRVDPADPETWDHHEFISGFNELIQEARGLALFQDNGDCDFDRPTI